MAILFGHDDTRGDILPIGDAITKTQHIQVQHEITGYECGVCERTYQTKQGIQNHLNKAKEEGGACRRQHPGCKCAGGVKVATCLNCAPIIHYLTEPLEEVP